MGDKVTPQAQHTVQLLSSEDFSLDRVRTESEIRRLCPYEVAMLIAKGARVIIADYYYVFHPSIREGFLKRINVALEDVILVLDEGHNLPERIKELASDQMSTSGVSRAVQEARKHGMDELAERIGAIGDALSALGEGVSGEAYADKERFIEEIENVTPFEPLVEELKRAADLVREEHRASSIGGLAGFLEAWNEAGVGFARIISREQGTLVGYELNVRCLDPAIFSRDVVQKCHATVLMSGTLLPTAMYKELLGMDRARELLLRSPFPRENQMTLVVPKTSTRYAQRSDQQYQDIAQIVSRALHSIPGNVAVFFPSYAVRDEVTRRVVTAKSALTEEAGMSGADKKIIMERMSALRSQGAVLFGVMGGSFSEGVDYPGDLLRGVIIVGLPLQRPDLETEALIKYYDGKFGKGWEYGYAFPAFNRMLQSAGRCIRTETDRGVIMLLDERYSWRGYAQLFPPDWDVKTSLLFEPLIERFFNRV
jgi:DNA excision repair protein ERCC-2